MCSILFQFERTEKKKVYYKLQDGCFQRFNVVELERKKFIG